MAKLIEGPGFYWVRDRYDDNLLTVAEYEHGPSPLSRTICTLGSNECWWMEDARKWAEFYARFEVLGKAIPPAEEDSNGRS